MLSILINAYACSPDMGSEPGMAWNWCLHLAKYCELHIITEGEFRDKIEAALPTIPQAQNMHFYYSPVSEKVRKMCWNQGDWRFYYYYKKWQKNTLLIAKQIIKSQNIDILHQLNMIGFREPGYLWKIKDIPFFWGPINAKETFPVSYLAGAPLSAFFFIRTKNFINKLQLRYSYRVRKAAKTASCVIGASSDASYSITKFWKVSPLTINESGGDLTDNELKPKTYNKTQMEILWVGRFIFTKQLLLAIKTISTLDRSKFILHIVGGTIDEELKFKQIINNLNLNLECVWHGKVSHEQVQKLMQQSDLFFFTSIAEGTPHVVLEAINNKLPVLCFDTCGHGDCVNEKVGIKIPLSTPEQSVLEFSEKLNFLYKNRKFLQQLSENCSARQQELSWEKKAEKMVELYTKVLKTNIY